MEPNMTNTKECSTCGEPIKSRARRCPHCHTWVSKWRIDTTHPIYQCTWLFIFVAVMWFFMIPILSKSDYSDYHNSLTVSESKMHFSETGSHAHISVIGNVTNSSEITWEDIHFEAQFFDSAGKLIDVITDTDYALVIQANGQSAFRVRGRADKPKELYDHFEIQIKKARESNKWF